MPFDSVAVTVTVALHVPTVPAVSVKLQLSLVVVAPIAAASAAAFDVWQGAIAPAAIVGGMLSRTVNTPVHVPVLPAPSVAERITFCGPLVVVSEPASGDCVTGPTGPQLSDVVA